MVQAAALVAHELNTSVARTLEEAREELRFGLGDILRSTTLHLLSGVYSATQPIAVSPATKCAAQIDSPNVFVQIALVLLISPILFAAFVRPAFRVLTLLPRVLKRLTAVGEPAPVPKGVRHVRFELPPARMPVVPTRSPAAYRRAVSLPPGV